MKINLLIILSVSALNARVSNQLPKQITTTYLKSRSITTRPQLPYDSEFNSAFWEGVFNTSSRGIEMGKEIDGDYKYRFLRGEARSSLKFIVHGLDRFPPDDLSVDNFIIPTLKKVLKYADIEPDISIDALFKIISLVIKHPGDHHDTLEKLLDLMATDESDYKELKKAMDYAYHIAGKFGNNKCQWLIGKRFP